MSGKVTIHPLVRFLRSVDLSNPSGCWLWHGAFAPNGYGQFSVRCKLWRAHRFAYEFLIGSIPLELEIDHLCKVRACVNPRHLEPVTHKENTLRGSGFAAQNARKKACTNGHSYDKRNTYYDSLGKRHCRTCHRIRERNRLQSLRS